METGTLEIDPEELDKHTPVASHPKTSIKCLNNGVIVIRLSNFDKKEMPKTPLIYTLFIFVKTI